MAKRGRKQPSQQQQQPYDNTLKSLIEGHEQEMLPLFLQGAVFLAVLNIEVLRTPLRVDRVYKVRYRGRVYILHLEFESGSDGKMAYRLLSYHSYFLEKYDALPIISIIIYPFPTSIAESPLREMDGDKEILTFHFQVLCLWRLDAEHFIREHIVSMYALLPTMRGVNAQMLNQAIDEMAQWYQGNDAQLANQLKWLGVMLRRAEIMPLEDKHEIEERLDMWDNLLEQDPYLQKKIARGRIEGEAKGKAEGEAKGKAEGRAKGEIEGLQNAVVRIVKGRFPDLAEQAQQKVTQVHDASILYYLIEQLAAAPDETVARWLLRPSVV
jgi:predicted transposase YdaD